jgi:threonylcarbamoyladenosine tRNA methylthiotransferase CDKAL1
VYIKTWGCSHNNSDGEYMAGVLASEGYTITGEKSKADVWLLNSCTVKNPSQDVFINEIRSGKAAGAAVVVAGCVPQGQPKGAEWAGLSVIGTLYTIH